MHPRGLRGGAYRAYFFFFVAFFFATERHLLPRAARVSHARGASLAGC